MIFNFNKLIYLSLLTLLVLGCTYSTKSIDDRMAAIAAAMQQQNAYIQAAIVQAGKKA